MEHTNGLKDFPQEIVDTMTQRQVQQGNVSDSSVFDEDIYAGKNEDGFNWRETEENHDFWEEVLVNKKFDLFFKKYPKKGKPIQIKINTYG